MPKGTVLYVPETAEGRLVFLGEELPVWVEDVETDARRPGERVGFDLTWEGDELRASNVRRARKPWARDGRSPVREDGRTKRGGPER